MITITFGKNKQSVKNMVSVLLRKENIPFSYTNDIESKKIILLDANHNDFEIISLTKDYNLEDITLFCTLIDADSDFKIPENNDAILISYGLNPLSTAIVSSIQATDSGISFLFCLQRQIKTIKGKILDPQEFPVTVNKEISINDALAFCLLALILEIPKEKISLI